MNTHNPLTGDFEVYGACEPVECGSFSFWGWLYSPCGDRDIELWGWLFVDEKNEHENAGLLEMHFIGRKMGEMFYKTKLGDSTKACIGIYDPDAHIERYYEKYWGEADATACWCCSRYSILWE